MNTLTIKWRRLVDGKGKTCPRCAATGKALTEAARCLKIALASRSIKVALEKERMTEAEFKKSPLNSNEIEINGRRLESWVGGKRGRSKCCATCGDAQCRTVKVGKQVHEAIPVPLIVRAGLVAATSICGPSDYRGNCRCAPQGKRKTKCGKKSCSCPCN